jgi:hypothetical protein
VCSSTIHPPVSSSPHGPIARKGLVAEVKSLLRAGKKLSEAQGGDVVSVNLSVLAELADVPPGEGLAVPI